MIPLTKEVISNIPLTLANTQKAVVDISTLDNALPVEDQIFAITTSVDAVVEDLSIAQIQALINANNVSIDQNNSQLASVSANLKQRNSDLVDQNTILTAKLQVLKTALGQ